ncbi:hypothetical protein B0H13DRAFT_2372240 [Mycena leptocephala]|nr:hypothetical protein B0H13DRAFT_2372240 [Mycena leptocephala]
MLGLWWREKRAGTFVVEGPRGKEPRQALVDAARAARAMKAANTTANNTTVAATTSAHCAHCGNCGGSPTPTPAAATAPAAAFTSPMSTYILGTHFDSEDSDSLHPKYMPPTRYTERPLVLDDIGSLVRFYACLRSQQEFGKIRRFFKQMEITAQLGACEAELESVLDSFKVTSRAISSMAVTDLCAQAAQRHQEILELLETYSISQYSDAGSLVTMRGAERPGNVKWTRPFLPPLEPISASASRQTFVDIVDEPKADEEAALVELIELTGNLPLAVRLMANVASFEGYLGALARWKTENTALLSDGYDKRSNLEKSLAVSLTSPRIKSNPHALGLLSLLSLLPDGISEAELHSSHVPLSAVSRCRTTLVQTSLAFIVDGRVKALSPIRDYMRSVYPASIAITRPLRTHFQELLKVWDTYYGLSPKDLVTQLTSHLGNIQSLFLNSITTEAWRNLTSAMEY